MPNGDEPRIVTPYNEDRMFVFNKKSGLPQYVHEIPGCRFEGFPICLATGNRAEIPRLIAMLQQFRGLWSDLADRGLPCIRVG